MTIQWYPGHMHKAQKEIKESLPKVDILIEVLDARIPFSSENPLLARLRRDKPCIKVLNKADLADPAVIALWQRHFEQQRNVKVFPTSTEDKSRIKSLSDLCLKLLPHKRDDVTPFRAMVAGIPNVGKSTLINVLAGRAVAKTGNEPAVTKGQQFIRVSDSFWLLDTPGILWPKQKYENASYRLALTGAIKDTAMDYDDVAFFGVENLLKLYPELMCARYKLLALPASEMAFFESVGRARGCLGAGGRVDITKIAEIFVREFRDGSIGQICLETPAMMLQEIEEQRLRDEQENLRREQEEAESTGKKNKKKTR